MEHIAIMKRSLGFLNKIIKGNKTLESRWYKTKYPPWGKIKKGDILYFKDSGKPVTIKSEVEKVIHYSDLSPKRSFDILHKYNKKLGIDNIHEFYKIINDKKYCILIFFTKVEMIKPFNINKSGYGMLASWIVINDVNIIKTHNINNVE